MSLQAVAQDALIKDALDALKIGKITMMMQKNTVFYTTILFSLKQEITVEIPTAATDGRRLLVNPQFFMDLSPNERITLLAHEVLHVALDHMHRIGDRNPRVWNIAGDYVINGHLVDAGYTLPQGGLYDKKYNGKTTEEVYNEIYKKPPKEIEDLIGKCTAGSLNGNDIHYPQDAKSPDQVVSQDEVTTIILRASTQAQAAGQPPGSIPGEIEIELKRVINPPLPWHVILMNYFTEFNKGDYSFRRPNRRFLPDHYLPTAHSEAITNLVIAVDTSGSVTDHEFHTFISKISEIQETLAPKEIKVIAFDTAIKSVQKITESQNPLKELKFTGRGGTNILPILEWAAQNRPTVMLVFTDGEFTKHNPIDAKIPMVWLIHDNPNWQIHYGRVIHYNIYK
jgi:predicted metal-dependent peptidase